MPGSLAVSSTPSPARRLEQPGFASVGPIRLASQRYIGSKARIAETILDQIGPPNGGVFVDAFCGTGSVAAVASHRGWTVHVNDHLSSATFAAFARLLPRQRLVFQALDGYENAVRRLNRIVPIPGFFWREYSPASKHRIGTARKYFTEENAMRIDGMRALIRDWHRDNLIDPYERVILLSDLMIGVNRVANTAGTYGCFLSTWQRQAHDLVMLVPRPLARSGTKATMSVGEAVDVPCTMHDTVYLDPPYTKRQYAAYYHILETLALGDEPAVSGICGIRPWRHLASPYCYRTRALNAIVELVERLPARNVYLSYSAEAHISIEDLSRTMRQIGRVSQVELSIVGRYRPNQAASAAGSKVREFLFRIDKA